MELKSCPFCGSNTLEVRKGKYMWWVECCNMGCRASGGVSNLKAKAIEIWNRRCDNG